MQIVFRVFLKRGTCDPKSANSYVVQALISPGVDHHQLIHDLARPTSKSSLPEASQPASRIPMSRHGELRPAEPHFVATSEDLTLEMVNAFLARVLAEHPASS